MFTDEDITGLAAELLLSEDSDRIINENICAATSDRRWDEVIKWNRVSWRLKFLRRSAVPGRSDLRPAVSAAP